MIIFAKKIDPRLRITIQYSKGKNCDKQALDTNGLNPYYSQYQRHSTMRYPICLLFTITICLSAFSQSKSEKEVRLNTEEVLPTALSYVDSFNFNKKVRWYREIGMDGISLEAKTKYKGQRYSIEFNEDGTLEDIEIEISSEDISTQIRDTIFNFLKRSHEKCDVKKIQIQYIGSREAIWAYLNNKPHPTRPEINYEIVLHAKENKVYKAYEYLFSENGQCLQSTEIIQDNIDHLEY
jgi:hypothetical protein